MRIQIYLKMGHYEVKNKWKFYYLANILYFYSISFVRLIEEILTDKCRSQIKEYKLVDQKYFW